MLNKMPKLIVVDLECNDIPIRVNNLKELEEEIKGFFLHEFRGSEEECPQNLTECIEFLNCNGMMVLKPEDCINEDLL